MTLANYSYFNMIQVLLPFRILVYRKKVQRTKDILIINTKYLKTRRVLDF